MPDVRAALTAARLPLLAFHQALIQAEHRRRVATAGPITPAAFLQELLQSESLAWLKPMTAAILETDERLDEPTTPAEALTASLAQLRQLLGPTAGLEARIAGLLAEAPQLPALRQAVLTALGPVN
jgi:hypothetical protein